MTDDRITWHLENWAYWQRDDSSRTRSSLDDPERGAYSSRASGGMGVSSRSDFDSMCDAQDRRCADAVDAILWQECRPLEREAVTHLHLASVFRFARVGYLVRDAYATARQKVGRGLDRRGIV